MLTASLSRQGGGVFDAVAGLAHGLAAPADVQVRALGLQDEYTHADAAPWHGLAADALKVAGPRAFGFAPGLGRALRDAAPDLLHLHGLWMYPSAAARAWSRRTGRPVVISPHGMLDPWAVRHSRWKKRLAGWLYEYRNLRRAACLHALCEPEAQAMRAYGLRNAVCVIPNGVQLPEEGALAPTPTPWADAVPAGARVLLYLGRLHPKKNLHALLRAWAQAGAQMADWWLVIAGWDQRGHQAQLKHLAAELGAARACFTGPQFGAAKDACFRQADAFVLPSLSEGLPMVVLEAWAYRLPVLMTAHCNLPAGFTADAALPVGTDPAEIGEGLRALAALGDADRKAMGARGRALVERDFTWPQVAGQMLDVYRWVLGEGPRPACVVG